MSIRVGVYGYGNLGRGVIKAARATNDMEVVAVFTRRDPKSLIVEGVNVYHVDEALKMTDDIDVMVLCGGSATDLPTQTVELSKYFNVIDSFDTHAKIPEHFESVNKNLLESQHTGMISVGWDPGLFSINRLMAESILPKGNTYTFWGKGVSQGHSDAIRRIEGVLDAKQYTCPVDEALERVRNAENPQLTTREKHRRECFVVAREDADKEAIERAIKTMPNYFADYDTTVTFVTQNQLDENYQGYPHGGFVIRSGLTDSNNQVMEFSLKLDSNPEFTASVIVAYARAVAKMYEKGEFGCQTVFDVPLKYLSENSYSDIVKRLL